VNTHSPEERIRRYFRHRAGELSHVAEIAICEHSGLTGGHRETIQRLFFEHVLPKRFSIGRGMVYGPFHRSREADIVIWDSQNYPSLPLSDHGFFFAESVRAVLECKSTFSTEEFKDVCDKARAVKDIIAMHEPGLASTIEMLQYAVHALQTGKVFNGIMHSPHHIGTGAIFLTGGHRQDWKEIAQNLTSNVDDAWPDICLMLQPGVILLKEYVPAEGWMGGSGYLSQYSFGEDALLAFTYLLFQMLFERVTALETSLELSSYAPNVLRKESDWSESFPLTRAVPQHYPFLHKA
jgi:hypothetical protein